MRDSHSRIKELESRKRRLEDTIRRLRADKSEISKEIGIKESSLRSIDQQLDRIRNASGSVVVTEHAILRYLERVEGIDIEAVKNRMVSESAQRQIKNLGSGVFPVGSSHKLRVRKGHIVTVLTEDLHGDICKKKKK